MSLRSLILALAATLLLAAPVAASATDGDPKFPVLTGDVVDDANVLSPATEMVLTRELADLRHDTGHRLVVVTVPSLQGRDIADYGIRLFRAWKVGRAGQDDGAILLIAPNERTDRIEVGYKLEPVLTDAASKTILTDLRPRLKAGDYDGAALIGERAIVSLISGPPGQPPPPKPTMELETPVWVWVILAGFAALLLGAAWLVIWAVRAAIRSAKGAREAARAARTVHGAAAGLAAGLSPGRRAPTPESMMEEFDARWNANQQAFEQQKAEMTARFEAARDAARASGALAATPSATGADKETAQAVSDAAVASAAEWPEPSVFPETTPAEPAPWAWAPTPAPTPPEPAAWPDPPTPPAAAPDDSTSYTGGSAGGGGADDKW